MNQYVSIYTYFFFGSGSMSIFHTWLRRRLKAGRKLFRNTDRPHALRPTTFQEASFLKHLLDISNFFLLLVLFLFSSLECLCSREIALVYDNLLLLLRPLLLLLWGMSLLFLQLIFVDPDILDGDDVAKISASVVVVSVYFIFVTF